jgi:Putative auto-transporter adhesin, head GIN domain
MKRRQLLEAGGAFAGAALVAGCSTTWTINGGGNMVRGSGRVVQESRPIQGVRAIEVSGSGRLEYVLDVAESLTVEAEDNILPLLSSEVRDGTLVLGPKPNTSMTTNKGVTYRVALPQALESLKMWGSTSARISELKGGGKTTFTLQESSKAIVASFDGDSVEADLHGSSQLTIESGQARDQIVKVFDSSTYTADGFKTPSGTITASNSGSAVVNVTGALNATAVNSGSVRYAGSPTVSRQVKDSGKVEPR